MPQIAQLMRLAGAERTGDDHPLRLLLVTRCSTAQPEPVDKFPAQCSFVGFQKANGSLVGHPGTQRLDRTACADVR